MSRAAAGLVDRVGRYGLRWAALLWGFCSVLLGRDAGLVGLGVGFLIGSTLALVHWSIRHGWRWSRRLVRRLGVVLGFLAALTVLGLIGTMQGPVG